jgi:hypothetical protein
VGYKCYTLIPGDVLLIVVPEFATLAAIVMAISIGALVTLTRFKNTKYNIN